MINSIGDTFWHQLTEAQYADHRRCVCIFDHSVNHATNLLPSGQPKAVEHSTRIWQHCANVLNRSSLKSVIAFTSDANTPFEQVQSNHFQTILGRECDAIVIDARQSLSVNMLAAACGLVRGGGLILIWLPDKNYFPSQPCSEQLRLFGEHLDHDSRFIKRLIDSIDSTQSVLTMTDQQWLTIPIVQKNSEIVRNRNDHQKVLGHQKIESHKKREPQLDTKFDEQRHAISAIKKVFTGHAKRPLVLTADRGRGKSAALGIAAAELVNQTQKKLCIIAPKKSMAYQVFEWFTKTVIDDYKDHLTFLSPDDCIHFLKTNQWQYDGLLVDEAAAIPSPMLQAIVSRVNRVCFSTTTQGYEGSGKGFAIRFTSYLTQRFPQWRQIELKQPIRWQDNDPVEDWLNAMLLLKATHNESHWPDFSSSNVTIQVFNPDENISNDILHQAFQLLINAHYQTTPDDLRQLLDHPARYFFVAEINGRVIGCALVLQEGNVDSELAEKISRGQRRLKGHLVPQSLAYQFGEPSLAESSCFRVQRIAVEPELHRRGVASLLMNSVQQHANKQSISYLSTSFAFTQDVLAFWNRNGFQPIRLGYSRDHASGCHSLIMVKSLSQPNTFDPWINQFYRHVSHLLSSTFQLIEPSLVFELFKSRRARQSVNMQHDSFDVKQVNDFAKGWRQLEDALPSLQRWLFSEELTVEELSVDEDEAHHRLASIHWPLLVAVFWQRWDTEACCTEFEMAGKKAVVEQLRQEVAKVIGLG